MSFQFVGNYKCLDFINTEVLVRGKPMDLLNSFEDLVVWMVVAGILNEAEAGQVRTNWTNFSEVENLLIQAKALRTRLREAVKDIIQEKEVPEPLVTEINSLLARQTGYAELVRTRGGGFEKRTHASLSEPIQMLVPLAESFADLLCYGDLTLVRKCENSACVLHFYDTTKNHTRRWCSMEVCGNRAKAAAHYLRKRTQTDRP
ncbi:MAG: CGNR zinc finger domain-containing protein [Blastocatellia bacterium]|nr:CGNR zinc finger domain-containing protein [Blastocatellia bacterium]